LGVALVLVSLDLWVRSWPPAQTGAAAKTGPPLVEAKVDDVTRLRYVADDVDVTFVVAKDDLGRYVEGAGTVKRAPDPRDAAKAHDGGGLQPDEREIDAATTKTARDVRFVSRAAAERLLERLAPFATQRVLEDVPASRLAEFGFEPPRGRLEVEYTGAGARVFEVGDALPGNRQVYIRDATSGRIALVDVELERSLALAEQRLPVKELFGVSAQRWSRISLEAGASRSTWVRRGEQATAEDAGGAGVREGSDTIDDAFPALVDALVRLRARDEAVTASPGDAAVPRVRLVVEDAEGKVMSVALIDAPAPGPQVVADAGSPAPAAPASRSWIARSNLARGDVSVSATAAEDLVSSVEGLLAR
jgi:hypothetical protein